jgi:hypothetical protein
MPRPETDFRQIIGAVEIQSPDVFCVEGERYEALTPPSAPGTLAQRIANALYYRRYCRPTRKASALDRPDPRAARVFVELLSHANSGTGTGEPGWVVHAVEDDGALVVRRLRDDILVWARPDEFRSPNGTSSLGSVGRVRVAKELREMLQGFYGLFGDADRSDEGNGASDIVRFYWHLTKDGAVPWVRELTERFNAAGLPFHAKVLNDPASYARADAGVLYLERRHVERAMASLVGLHAATVAGLRSTTPMFTKRLAHGLSVAEDPGNGHSFGQHRCQLVAEGLVRAFGAEATGFQARWQAVVNRFADAGLSVERPWLNTGSRQAYRWSRRTSPP